MPGTYAIQADYSYTPKLKGKEVWTGKLKHKEVWTGTLLSNPLKITVMKQPAPHDPKKIRWGKVTKGVRYGLTFDKLIHGWFEPITGTVSVEAPGGPADVPETVAISCGGGYQHVPLTADPDALRRSRTLRLKKGERRTARFDLTFFAQRHGFPRPATMEFNAAWYPKMQAPRVLVLDLVHSLGRPSAAVTRGLVEVVRPAKATFTQGEPLVFRTTLRNVTKQPVLVYDAGYYPEWNHMITAADGKSWWRTRRLERVDRVPPPPITPATVTR